MRCDALHAPSRISRVPAQQLLGAVPLIDSLLVQSSVGPRCSCRVQRGDGVSFVTWEFRCGSRSGDFKQVTPALQQALPSAEHLDWIVAPAAAVIDSFWAWAFSGSVDRVRSDPGLETSISHAELGVFHVTGSNLSRAGRIFRLAGARLAPVKTRTEWSLKV